MSKAKARRVNYRINYCSSEDPEYPVSELVLQSAEAKGWQTKRFAPFPQTLIIELLELTQVNNLTFLSHQNKICTKIEIEVKEDHDDNWTRLGYTTLQSGLNTGYQSRQLRNVVLNGRPVLVFRFTFHQNYANNINIFNQIGIIALIIYGDKLQVERNSVRNQEGALIGMLSDLDKETILKLKNLQSLKKEAIDNNNFDEAQRLKVEIQKLQSNIKALAILQKQKKEAIRKQNYEQAKQIVERMKRLRGPMLFDRDIHSSNNNSNIFTPKRKSVNSSMSAHKDINNEEEEVTSFYNLPPKAHKPPKSFEIKVQPKRNYSMVIPHDEIKIQPKNRYPTGEYDDQAHQTAVEDDEQTKLPHSKGQLQRLHPDTYEECKRYFPVFNQITFQYLMSRDHSNREKGISLINDLMSKANADNPKYNEQFVNAVVFVVKKLIDDKIMPVLIAIVDFFGMTLKKFRPANIGASSKNVKYILEKISDYLGHNNDKFRQECEDVFASLPAHALTNKDLCLQILCNLNKQKNPKIVCGRLSVAAKIVEKFKIGRNQGMVIGYGKAFLQDKNSEVRSCAVDLMVKVSKEIGYENLHPLISNMKPQVIKNIEDKIEEEGGVIQKVEGSRARQNQSKQAKMSTNPQYYCDYCQLYDKRFEDDNFRDKHLFSSCPMINLCRECHQAVEVSNLNNHLLNECTNHKYYKKCPKCKEAIASREYNMHTKLKDCITAKAPSQANRCPLCHEDIQPNQSGWVKHLVNEGCPNNHRQ